MGSRFSCCRLIVETAPRSGAWNMAVDEALLESAAASGVPTVRWYRWSSPTLSLGYFQKAEAIPRELREAGIDVVRRLTGGGAIIHHHEWTYSVTLPTLGPLLSHPYQLYDLVHEALIESLHSEFGLSLSQRRDTGTPSRVSEPMLCYLRHDAHDVCLQNSKVIGSAQRRRRGALLQHGSLLLKESAFAPGIRGVYDLAPQLSGALDEPGQWQAKPADVLANSVVVGELLPEELATAERLLHAEHRHS